MLLILLSHFKFIQKIETMQFTVNNYCNFPNKSKNIIRSMFVILILSTVILCNIVSVYLKSNKESLRCKSIVVKMRCRV